MRPLLPLVAAAALLAAAPAPSGAVISPVNVCTSLTPICVGGCSTGDVVRVQVIGRGYGDAICGNATAYCHSTSQLGTCQDTAIATTGSSWIRCLADPYGSQLAIAICTSEKPIYR